MKTPICLSTAVLILAAGCNNESSTSTGSETNATTNASSPLTAPVDYLGALAKAKQSAVKTVDTSSLKEAIEMFQVDHGRYPKDLNELVQEKYIPRIPDAPYGMKLLYDPNTGQVSVVKQTQPQQ